MCWTWARFMCWTPRLIQWHIETVVMLNVPNPSPVRQENWRSCSQGHGLACSTATTHHAAGCWDTKQMTWMTKLSARLTDSSAKLRKDRCVKTCRDEFLFFCKSTISTFPNITWIIINRLPSQINYHLSFTILIWPFLAIGDHQSYPLSTPPIYHGLPPHTSGGSWPQWSSASVVPMSRRGSPLPVPGFSILTASGYHYNQLVYAVVGLLEFIVRPLIMHLQWNYKKW